MLGPTLPFYKHWTPWPTEKLMATGHPGVKAELTARPPTQSLGQARCCPWAGPGMALEAETEPQRQQ